MIDLSKKKPDLKFFFSVDKDITTISKIILGLEIIETFNGNIYSDSSLTAPIGRWLTTQTIINYDNNNSARSGILTFFLPEGSIDIINTRQIIKNKQDIYVSPSGTYPYKIVSGSDDFLLQEGFLVVIVDNDTLIREVLVYFDKDD